MTNKDKIILQKILAYVDEVSQYVKGYNFDSFLEDRKTISACSFIISQIGELSKELSEAIQNDNPNIPWISIRGMRNKIVHDYENIDYMVLWGTIETSLPELKRQLAELIKYQ